jgi:hypothetical protein
MLAFGGLVVSMILLTIGFSGILTGSSIEGVKNDWANKRCNLFIMFTAFLYKSKDDSRTSWEFSKDNFSYCADQLGTDTARKAFAPLYKIFEQLLQSAKQIMSVANSLRIFIANKMKTFSTIINERFYKFIHIFDQFRLGYVKMLDALKKSQAITTALLFQGLSGIRFILNMKDFVIKVVLIIMAILIAMMIFMFFLVIPFVPIVIAPTLAVLAGVGVGVAGSDAFCLHPDTIVPLADYTLKKISTIQLGEILPPGLRTYWFPNRVTGILEADGSTTKLYEYKDILMSGTHRIYEAGKWILARDLGVVSEAKSDRLYILNTAHHYVPCLNSIGQYTIVNDWEEVDSVAGQKAWMKFVAKELQTTYAEMPTLVPLLGEEICVVGEDKYKKDISSVKIGDFILDRDDTYTKVIGFYKGIVKVSTESKNWMTDGCWILENNRWRLFIEGLEEDKNTFYKQGWNLITESGSFMIRSGALQYIVRDFTECGWMNLEKCYETLDNVL